MAEASFNVPAGKVAGFGSRIQKQVPAKVAVVPRAQLDADKDLIHRPIVPGAAMFVEDYNGDSLPAGTGNGGLVIAVPAVFLVLTLLGWCYWTWFGCICNQRNFC